MCLTSFHCDFIQLVLWPLFHYILWDEATDGREERRNWEDYVFVNQKFADAIVEQYQTGDISKDRVDTNKCNVKIGVALSIFILL